MGFAQRQAITDICVLVNDLDASIRFYAERLGFILAHRAPGFADFTGAGVTLALWDRAHIATHIGVRAMRETRSALLIAMRLDRPADIDASYEELAAKGVIFVGAPANYPWNARCAYFNGPDGETWELYAWLPGGAPGTVAAP